MLSGYTYDWVNGILYGPDQQVRYKVKDETLEKMEAAGAPAGTRVWTEDVMIDTADRLVTSAALRAFHDWGDGGQLGLSTIIYLTNQASALDMGLSGVVSVLDQCDKIEADVAENLQKRRFSNLKGKALESYKRSKYEPNAREGEFGYYIDRLYGVGGAGDPYIGVYFMANIAQSSANAYRDNSPIGLVPGEFSEDAIDMAITWGILANLWCFGQNFGQNRQSPWPTSVEAQGALQRALAIWKVRTRGMPRKLWSQSPIFTDIDMVTRIRSRANARCAGLLDRHNPQIGFETYHDTEYHHKRVTAWTGTTWASAPDSFDSVYEAVGLVRTFYVVLCYLMNFVRVDESYGNGRYVYTETNKVAHSMHIQRVVQYGKTVQDLLSSTIEAIMSAVGFDAHASHPRFDALLNRMRRCVFRLKHEMFHAPTYILYSEVMQVAVEMALPVSKTPADLLALAKSSMEKALASQSKVLDLSLIDTSVEGNRGYMSMFTSGPNSVSPNPVTEAAERAFACTGMYGGECSKHLTAYAYNADVALSACHLAQLRDTNDTKAETLPLLRYRSPIALDAARIGGLSRHESEMRKTLPVSMQRHISIWLSASDAPTDVVSATRVVHDYCRVLCYLRNLAHLYTNWQHDDSDDIVELLMPYGWTVLAIIAAMIAAMRANDPSDLGKLARVETQLAAYYTLFLAPQSEYANLTTESMRLTDGVLSTLQMAKVRNQPNILSVTMRTVLESPSPLLMDVAFRKLYFPFVTWGSLWRPLRDKSFDASEQLDFLSEVAATTRKEAVDAIVSVLSFKQIYANVVTNWPSMVDADYNDGMRAEVERRGNYLKYLRLYTTTSGPLVKNFSLAKFGFIEASQHQGILRFHEYRNTDEERPMLAYHRDRAGYAERAINHAIALQPTLRGYAEKMDIATGVGLLASRWRSRVADETNDAFVDIGKLRIDARASTPRASGWAMDEITSGKGAYQPPNNPESALDTQAAQMAAAAFLYHASKGWGGDLRKLDFSGLITEETRLKMLHPESTTSDEVRVIPDYQWRSGEAVVTSGVQYGRKVSLMSDESAATLRTVASVGELDRLRTIIIDVRGLRDMKPGIDSLGKRFGLPFDKRDQLVGALTSASHAAVGTVAWGPANTAGGRNRERQNNNTRALQCRGGCVEQHTRLP